MRTLAVIVLFVLAAGLAYGQEAVEKGSPQLKSISLPDVSAPLREGEGRVVTESFCGICHSTEYIPMQPKLTKAQWSASVNKMIKAFGAPIDEKSAQEIVQYLGVNYGTGR